MNAVCLPLPASIVSVFKVQFLLLPVFHVSYVVSPRYIGRLEQLQNFKGLEFGSLAL